MQRNDLNLNAGFSSMYKVYFFAIGILSESRWGHELIQESGVFEKTLKVVKPEHFTFNFYTKFESLVPELLNALDYFAERENRDFLEKVLSSGSARICRQIVLLLTPMCYLRAFDGLNEFVLDMMLRVLDTVFCLFSLCLVLG